MVVRLSVVVLSLCDVSVTNRFRPKSKNDSDDVVGRIQNRNAAIKALALCISVEHLRRNNATVR